MKAEAPDVSPTASGIDYRALTPGPTTDRNDSTDTDSTDDMEDLP